MSAQLKTVLEAARNSVAAGWMRGWPGKKGSCTCSNSAIHDACCELELDFNVFETLKCEASRLVLLAAGVSVHGPKPANLQIIDWNDACERTWGEVVMAFDKALNDIKDIG